MITVCDVWKAFNRRDVLAGTSFYIRSGEVVGLLGANGAGKTTLYRILCGLMRPNTGAVYVNGTHPQSADRSLLSVFFGGSARVYDRLSARENIRYFARLHGIPHAEYMRRLDFFSGILGMESYLDRRTQ
ncbi:MAG: ATP-binding cassette domain-containing protein, partial [Spirochaetota bacterium]